MTDPVNNSTPLPSPDTNRTMLVTERMAQESSKRLVNDKQGNLMVIRFPLLTRILHGLLLVAISLLAFSGMAQVFHTNKLGTFMLRLMGGLEKTQKTHHVFAILLAVVVLLHLLDIMERTFVKRQSPAMLPRWKDMQDAFQGIRYKLGTSQPAPRHDRFSFEQKAVYLAVLLGVVLQGVTGFARWFPARFTEFLPGISIAYAGILHRWTALFIIVVVFIWHLYQVHVRQHNLSIFSGRMSLFEMQSEHPLELEYLQKAAACLGSPNWPVAIILENQGSRQVPSSEGQTDPNEDTSARNSE